MARDPSRLAGLVDDLRAGGIRADGVSADARRPAELRRALRELADRLGPTSVLCFSPLPDVSLIKPVLTTEPADFVASFELGVAALATTLAEVLPNLRRAVRGTVLVTTGSGALVPSADRAASGVTTTAVAVYARMLHDALAPDGVHVVHTTVVGPIGPGQRHEPTAVAEHLWQCHVTRDEAATVLR